MGGSRLSYFVYYRSNIKWGPKYKFNDPEYCLMYYRDTLSTNYNNESKRIYNEYQEYAISHGKDPVSFSEFKRGMDD